MNDNKMLLQVGLCHTRAEATLFVGLWKVTLALSCMLQCPLSSLCVYSASAYLAAYGLSELRSDCHCAKGAVQAVFVSGALQANCVM